MSNSNFRKTHLKPALPPKPAVPPKPVLHKNLGLCIPGNQRKKLPNQANMKIINDANSLHEFSPRDETPELDRYLFHNSDYFKW